MAKDLLVTDVLSESMMVVGAKLLERLDNSDSKVSSAFWLFFPEQRIWKLVIASPLVDSEGPKNFYKRIFMANGIAGEDEAIISLHDIGISSPEQGVVQLLRFAIVTGNSISGIRFSRNTINGHFIEDAYIYRSQPVASVDPVAAA